jgi:L,D-transpeptidase ErfK/SrfK
MRRYAVLLISAAVLCGLPARSGPLAADYARDGDVIGKEKTYRIRKNDSLPEIARRHDIGYTEIASANPGVDPFVPDPHRRIVVPTEWILPEAAVRNGIVINLAEMRLYLFSPERPQVTTFPVGIGDFGTETPLGTYSIVEKIRNPPWIVPPSIRKEKPDLPPVVPPGPDNPLGSRALRLSRTTFLIHGTDTPWGIGTRNSHGCIRMYEEDVIRLYGMVDPGTPVTIVNEPVKTAVSKGKVYLEVHDYGDGADLYRAAWKLLARKRLLAGSDLDKVLKASEERRGTLVDVTRRLRAPAGSPEREQESRGSPAK